jgi:uncharacterized membrane protein YfcA
MARTLGRRDNCGPPDRNNALNTSDKPATAPGSLRPFLVWLAAFYAVWLALVSVGDYWTTIVEHWPIALSMAAGSYFAGSTPMGGGTVGFPILVLLFDQPASLGRDFALAVQSIGMVSASIFILSRRMPVDWHLLRPALVGALVGTPFGAAFIAPNVPDLWVKLLFAVIWASFGVMHFLKVRPIVAATGKAQSWPGRDRPIGLAIGLAGGIVASLAGVGIDMMIYAVLVLLYRADLKIAIPTSVILMAFTSVVGIVSNMLLATLLPGSYAIADAVLYNWLAAAPIVALGAPFGAWVVNRLPRTPTLLIVSALCIGQFVWTLVKADVSGSGLLFAIGGVLAMNVVFHLMFEYGERRRQARHAAEAQAAV